MVSLKVEPKAVGLVAILFITRTRRGPRLLFHHPPDPLWPPLQNHTIQQDSDTEDSDDELEHDPHVSASVPKGFHPATSSSQILGLSIDSLEKLLSPGRWSDRKKFEICTNGLTFVGHPIYATEDGNWSKKATQQPMPSHMEESTGTLTGGQRTPNQITTEHNEPTANITITGPDNSVKHVHDFTHVPASLDSQTGQSLGTSVSSNSTTSAAIQDRLNMFHVVFAISSGSASDVYQRVARKLSKAMNYCQKQSNYVGVEAQKMIESKVKAKLGSISPTDTSMFHDSELAWSLKTLQESLAAGKVAGIRLNGAEMSLHISSQKSLQSGESTIGPYSGILLLEEKDHLLQELANTEASPLAYFIREHTPTKSLQKQANNLNLAINDVLYLCQHLVKWRKARVITPLRPSSQYVVNPDAQLEDLSYYTPRYARKFTALPSLPQMLKILSGRPIRYGLLVPSRDHRGPYMDLLADLVRDGFVVQLKTYGWLQGQLLSESSRDLTIAKPSAAASSLLSPHLRPVDDDNISVSSERTAFQRASTPVTLSDAGERDTILVLEPASPTVEEGQLIQQIRNSLTDPELRDLFTVLVQYFDGEHAFEEVAAREGVKRGPVERVMELLEDQGHLIVYGNAG